MRRIPIDPSEEFFELRDRLYRMLDESFASEHTESAPSFTPPVDILASNEEILILVELPGMRREEVSVEVEDSLVTISGERGDNVDGEFYVRERPTGEFRRSFSLAFELDPESVSARLDRGLLEVTVQRRERTRQIAVGESTEA